MYDDIRTTTVTVANLASLSGASLDLSVLGKPVAVITDAAWDTQAMTFQVSVDGVNFFNLYNEGSEYQIAGAAASHFHRVDWSLFYGVKFLKVRSGTGAAPVNQAGDSVVTLVCWQVED